MNLSPSNQEQGEQKLPGSSSNMEDVTARQIRSLLTSIPLMSEFCQRYFNVFYPICEPDELAAGNMHLTEFKENNDEHLLQFVFFHEPNKARFRYYSTATMKDVNTSADILRILAQSKTVFLCFLLESEEPPFPNHGFFVFNPQESALCLHFRPVEGKRNQYVAMLPLPEEDYLEYFFTQTPTSTQPKLGLKFQSFSIIFENYIKNFFKKDKPPRCLEAVGGNKITGKLFESNVYQQTRQALRMRSFFRFCTQLKRIPRYSTKTLFSSTKTNVGEWKNQARKLCEDLQDRVKICPTTIQNSLMCFCEQIVQKIVVPICEQNSPNDQKKMVVAILNLRDFTSDLLKTTVANVEQVANTLNFNDRLSKFGEFIFEQLGCPNEYQAARIDTAPHFASLNTVVDQIRQLLSTILVDFTNNLATLIKNDMSSPELIRYCQNFPQATDIAAKTAEIFKTKINEVVESFFKRCVEEIEKILVQKQKIQEASAEVSFFLKIMPMVLSLVLEDACENQPTKDSKMQWLKNQLRETTGNLQKQRIVEVVQVPIYDPENQISPKEEVKYEINCVEPLTVEFYERTLALMRFFLGSYANFRVPLAILPLTKILIVGNPNMPDRYVLVAPKLENLLSLMFKKRQNPLLPQLPPQAFYDISQKCLIDLKGLLQILRIVLDTLGRMRERGYFHQNLNLDSIKVQRREDGQIAVRVDGFWYTIIKSPNEGFDFPNHTLRRRYVSPNVAVAFGNDAQNLNLTSNASLAKIDNADFGKTVMEAFGIHEQSSLPEIKSRIGVMFPKRDTGFLAEALKDFIAICLGADIVPIPELLKHSVWNWSEQ